MGNTYTNKRGSFFFEETSQKIWGELQGSSQAEQEYTADFYGTDQNETVDINKLVDFIKRIRSSNIQSFNWEHYVSNATKTLTNNTVSMGGHPISTSNEIPVNINWIYSEKGYAPGNKVESKFNVKLNKRKNDFIDREDWSVRKFFNDNTKKYEFILSFYFQKTTKYRTNTIEDTFKIEEKYRAVQFKTDNLKDMFYLFKELEMNTTRLGEIVYDYIKEEKISEALAALYTQLPEELIVIMSNLDQDRTSLFDHLMLLKEYDENSIFEDSSLAILNLFRIIKDIKYIYEMLKLYPETVLQLYYNMDGSSTFRGKQKSNKLFFAEMMQGIYFANYSKESNISIVKTFKINEEYKIDSKISDNGDSGLIYLQQQKVVNVQGGGELVPGTPMPEGPMLQNVGNEDYLNPFDLVTLEKVENGKVTVNNIIALMLKAEADQVVKGEVLQSIHAGLIIAGIIIGIASMGTASGPLATALFATDVLLAVADVGLAVYEDAQLQSQEGEEFLNTYNSIMFNSARVVAPFFLASFFKTGLKLLKDAKPATGQFLRTCVLNVLLEKNIVNFEANTVKILAQNTEVVLATKAVLDAPKVARLYNHNCFLVSGNVTVNKKTVEEFALIYKGEVIAKGAKADFHKQIKEIGKNIHNEKRLVQTLDDLLKQKKFLKYADKFEVKFHLHFDGEFKIVKGELRGTGGHNHSVIDKDIKVRKYLAKPANNMPFDALISVRYKQGQWIEKQAKSSMFPKNWDIKRVKEEIAMVYDAMIKSGRYNELKVRKSPQFVAYDSSSRFKILIEFDINGNITNAYPLI